MRSTLTSSGLPSPTTLLFHRPITALLSKMNRKPINFNADDEHYEVLKHAEITALRAMILTKTHVLSLLGLQ